MFKKSTIAAALLSLSAVANAATVSLINTPTGELAIDGQAYSFTFNSAVSDTNASLGFVLQGYRTVDGLNEYADSFTLNINGHDYGNGFFNLGGGGASFAFNLGTPTYNGNTVSFSNLGFSLLKGTNTFTFRYTPAGAANQGGQGIGDEAWGINSASITAAVPEPESYAMLVAGLGLIGAVARRRSRKL